MRLLLLLPLLFGCMSDKERRCRADVDLIWPQPASYEDAVKACVKR
jgi:hypothetical protein